jgi:2-dehydro-3-deoxygalactonokinase
MSNELSSKLSITERQNLEWIAVDWGTSQFRAWAIGMQNQVLARADSNAGVHKVAAGNFEFALLKIIGDWLPSPCVQPIQVVICGMAGARQGWCEAPYRSLPCQPVSEDQLTEVSTYDSRIQVFIVPGLCQKNPVDVMRGEETQLAGLVSRIGNDSACVCLPGTHSKWAQLEAGLVKQFKTYMTGELFELLSTHSTLSFAISKDALNLSEFHRAVADALHKPADISNQLFSIRSTALVHGLDAQLAYSRLSGLLIGLELAATRELWHQQQVRLIGTGDLVSLYSEALLELGAEAVIEDVESLTIDGLSSLYHSLQIESVT